MTTETLKPFIPQQCVDNFPAVHVGATRRQRSTHLLAIGLSVTAVVMTLTLLGFTFWNLKRVSSLEAEVKSLHNVITNMQKRLGIDYLEDLQDFEKEYNNALIDDPDTLDNIHENVDEDDEDDMEDNDDEDDDDDDSSDFDYEEFRRKYSSWMSEDEIDEDSNDDEEDLDVSENDNVFSDFEKYKDSKKKQEKPRVTRAITDAHLSNEHPSPKPTKAPNMESSALPLPTQNHQTLKKKMLTMRLPNTRAVPSEMVPVASENANNKRNHRRHRMNMKTKNTVAKSGKNVRQLTPISYTPAAHFHLNRKVPDHLAAVNINSYNGDMYIGHPSWSNEIDHDHYFKVNNGVLTVHEPGLYYVYAQVCYNNTHDQNGFVIFHGHKPFLQCLNTVPTNMPHKIHTCHTSGLIYLKENETIHLRDFHRDRNVILKDMNNRSYFGLIKI